MPFLAVLQIAPAGQNFLDKLCEASAGRLWLNDGVIDGSDFWIRQLVHEHGKDISVGSLPGMYRHRFGDSYQLPGGQVVEMLQAVRGIRCLQPPGKTHWVVSADEVGQQVKILTTPWTIPLDTLLVL